MFFKYANGGLGAVHGTDIKVKNTKSAQRRAMLGKICIYDVSSSLKSSKIYHFFIIISNYFSNACLEFIKLYFFIF